MQYLGRHNKSLRHSDIICLVSRIRVFHFSRVISTQLLAASVTNFPVFNVIQRFLDPIHLGITQ